VLGCKTKHERRLLAMIDIRQRIGISFRVLELKEIEREEES